VDSTQGAGALPEPLVFLASWLALARTNKQMAKRKTILEVVHETARGLRDAGVMEAKIMRE